MYVHVVCVFVIFCIRHAPSIQRFRTSLPPSTAFLVQNTCQYILWHSFTRDIVMFHNYVSPSGEHVENVEGYQIVENLRQIFFSMEDEGHLDINNAIHLQLLHHMDLPLTNRITLNVGLCMWQTSTLCRDTRHQTSALLQWDAC